MSVDSPPTRSRRRNSRFEPSSRRGGGGLTEWRSAAAGHHHSRGGERSEQAASEIGPGSSNAVLGLAAKPSPRVPVAMDDSDHTDGSVVDFEIHSVRKPPEERSAKRPRHDRKALRPLTDIAKGFIERHEKADCSRWRLAAIPFERIFDLIPRRLPKAQGAHLASPFGQPIAQGFPRFSGIWIAIRVSFSTRKLLAKALTHRRRYLGIERVPEPADQLNAFVGGEFVNHEGPSCHEISLTDEPCRRNGLSSAALTEWRSAAGHYHSRGGERSEQAASEYKPRQQQRRVRPHLGTTAARFR
jgi:hypothetical protein